MLSLDVDVAILTNVELDHHATFASLAELRDAFRAFLSRARQAIVVWDDPELLALAHAAAPSGVEIVTFDVPPDTATAATDGCAPGGQRFPWRGHDVRLRVPGLHNALDATAALEAAQLVDADLPVAIAALGEFGGAARRFQRLGAGPGGAEIYEDYAHHPTEIAATLRGARSLSPQRLLAVFQPHLFSRTARLAREFGCALALADLIVVLDVYPARERAEDHPGVSGLLIAQAAADAAHGRPVYWLPTFAAAAPALRSLLRACDLCLVMGAGDVDALGRALVDEAGDRGHPCGDTDRDGDEPRVGNEARSACGGAGGGRAGSRGARGVAREPVAMTSLALPPGVQRDYPLARLATVRTGGPAELFARAGSLSQLHELLAWARAADTPVAVVGSGSNLLIADAGVPGLVLKLDRDLAAIERAGEHGLLCGGGARLPAVAARAATAGLAGIEFAVNIPGTVGGAVRMNANAYGGALARTLRWVQIVTASGSQRRHPEQLDFGYRRSNLRDGEVVGQACFELAPADPYLVKAALADLRARRHEAQPQGIRTFGSTFKNPSADGVSEGVGTDVSRTAGLLLSEAGCNGLAVGGARFAPKHANFIENTGTATTANIVALMALGRRRVLERFGIALEPEVQTLGHVRFAWRGEP